MLDHHEGHLSVTVTKTLLRPPRGLPVGELRDHFFKYRNPG